MNHESSIVSFLSSTTVVCVTRHQMFISVGRSIKVKQSLIVLIQWISFVLLEKLLKADGKAFPGHHVSQYNWLSGLQNGHQRFYELLLDGATMGEAVQ